MNNRHTFKVNEIEHTVLFGMVAQEIFQLKSIEEAIKANERGETQKVEQFKTFVIMVYAGLCNNADRIDVNRPSFTQAYDIAEGVESEDQKLIYEAFANSQPIQTMLEKLGVSAKSEDEVKKKQPSKMKLKVGAK